MKNRAIIIVLDSLGVGETPDADKKKRLISAVSSIVASFFI